eukprot:c21135_g1_i1.p1 GENE.c21135_g1_i1~~c21135_g1_i1.p1  ORF type:complete len:237 (+),score=31.99 c21135_g1_i1:34-711(+)
MTAGVCALDEWWSCGVDLTRPSFLLAVLFIAGQPTWWNIVARMEYRSKVLTRLACGSPLAGCYALAVAIFSLSLVRDWYFKLAIDEQPSVDLGALATPLAYVSYALFAWGTVLVVTSMWRLGVTGTYLGDYFGILMDARVTGFPFNVMEHPMYSGATMCFAAQALAAASPIGLVMTAVVAVVYAIAQSFEGAFTTMIYSKRAASQAAAGAASAASTGKKASAKSQ